MVLAGVEGVAVPSDCCLASVTGVSSKVYVSDCKAFLYTTVTPKKATVYRTVTVTSIPTVRKSVTGTSTKSYKDHIKIVTKQTTTTITTTVENVSPPFKRAANNVPAIPSHASKGCTNSAKYVSACSRVGVTSKAITLPRATVVSVIHRVLIPRRSTIKTTIETAYATKTVKTETVLQTYTTERVTRIVETATEDNFIATQTDSQTSTTTKEVDPVQTVYLIAHGSNGPNLAPLGGVGFTDLESQQGSRENYYIDFTADVVSTEKFTLNLRTGALVAVNGPGSSAGETAYYGSGSGSAWI
ncbi:CMGC protein kinase [Fusarium austroafricanum]|uniref:CMGC protein kinase n=1 Tax=Fusarium austroafricanum TaxID=2364996 RepID=A0A8H4NF00_9HYPO|nr:CMGC protein kinase [Fusarium austroafricanum]